MLCFVCVWLYSKNKNKENSERQEVWEKEKDGKSKKEQV